jgi:hypothetical protein
MGETVGVIRGEEHLPLNPVLAAAAADGMRLAYLDRSTYRQNHTPEVIGRLHDEYGDVYLLPEGGSNELAVRSCRNIPTGIDIPFDLICCAVGTGGTLANASPRRVHRRLRPPPPSHPRLDLRSKDALRPHRPRTARRLPNRHPHRRGHRRLTRPSRRANSPVGEIARSRVVQRATRDQVDRQAVQPSFVSQSRALVTCCG